MGAAPGWIQHAEVSGPRGLPVEADWILDPDGRAIIEAAQACGLALLAPDERDPLATTTWGVGQLVDAARAAGATTILVGLGGSATVDGGAGAVTALGWRTLDTDGSGLKVGGGELTRVAAIEKGWAADWSGVEVLLLADVTTTLGEAPARFGPQKGADAAAVSRLEEALGPWADLVENVFGVPGLRDTPGAGAAGGLAFGLAAATGGRIVAGAAEVARTVEFEGLVQAADLVITGEGRFDDTSSDGKVVSHVLDRAAAHGVDVVVVCGQANGTDQRFRDIEAAAPNGAGDDPAAEVASAAERLAARI